MPKYALKTLEIRANGNARYFTTGSSDLVVNGQSYEGTAIELPDGKTAQLLTVDFPEYVAGEVGSRASFSIALTEESYQRIYNMDLGYVECKIQAITDEATGANAFVDRFAYDVNEADNHTNIQSVWEYTIASEINIVPLRATSARWNSRDRNSTSSSGTGPSRNNQRKFIYFEATGGAAQSVTESWFWINGGQNGRQAITDWLNSNNRRRIVIVASLQGSGFSQAQDGLSLIASSDQTAPNPTTVQQVTALKVPGQHMSGWAYDDAWTQGQTTTDYAGNPVTFIYHGGWVEHTFEVPVGSRHVGLVADLDIAPSFQTDTAFTKIQLQEFEPITKTWRVIDHFTGQISSPVFESGVYSAEIEGFDGDIDRGRTEYLTHVDQQSKYPDDECLENVQDLVAGQRFTWE